MSSTKGKGLILLRACNEILRRTSKSNCSAFCGEISLLLSKSFPSAERSGVNLKGDLNIENITNFDKKIEAGKLESSFFASDITPSKIDIIFLK